MIGKGHLRVLEVLDSPTTRQELADTLDYSPKTISNVLGDLEPLALIDRERTGSQTLIRPLETRCITVYQSLVKSNPHIDFPELLSESTLVLLYHLTDELTPVATLVDRSRLSKATVYRQLDTLTNRAIVIKDHSQYRLVDEFTDLHTFAVELYHQIHRRRVSQETDGGVLVWETHDEFLVQTDHPVDATDYHRTGLAAFAEYGLEFFTTSAYYYFYSPSRDSLSPSDLICHLLLIENDARHRKYALLLLAKTTPSSEEVRDRASYYQVDDIVDPMPEYLETRGEETAPHLPPWDEFQSLAREYNVEI